MLVERRIVQDGSEPQVAAPHERDSLVAAGRDLSRSPARVDVARLARQREDEFQRRIAEGLGERAARVLRQRTTGAQVGEMALDAPQTLVAGAVEAPVDDALRPSPQLTERERRGQRRRRRRERRAGPERDAERQRHRAVGRRQQRGQRHVDERAVDEPIDLVEPIAHHRDADRQRDRDERDDE